MKTVILSGGKPPSLGLLKSELKECDILIGVDSGGNFLRDQGIIPDYLVGDFDSINKENIEYFKLNGSNIYEYPKDKDFTDTELALELAVKLRSDSIVFLGCTGSRIDHIMGNLGLLRKCIEKEIKGFIKDDHNFIMLSKKPLKLSGNKGKLFSVQAYCNEINNLTITGAKFPLHNHKLNLGDPITISNEFLEEYVHIDFSDGIIMIIYPRD
ncbi:MAG: thiamine diphosphokinase [Solirubrobacterales bacterium]